MRLSRETTYITEPVQSNGWPDYARAFEDAVRRGIEPSRNGAIPFLKAIRKQTQQSTIFRSTPTRSFIGMPPTK